MHLQQVTRSYKEYSWFHQGLSQVEIMKQDQCYRGYMRMQSQRPLVAEGDGLQPEGPRPAAAQALLGSSQGV